MAGPASSEIDIVTRGKEHVEGDYGNCILLLRCLCTVVQTITFSKSTICLVCLLPQLTRHGTFLYRSRSEEEEVGNIISLVISFLLHPGWLPVCRFVGEEKPFPPRQIPTAMGEIGNGTLVSGTLGGAGGNG